MNIKIKGFRDLPDQEKRSICLKQIGKSTVVGVPFNTPLDEELLASPEVTVVSAEFDHRYYERETDVCRFCGGIDISGGHGWDCPECGIP